MTFEPSRLYNLPLLGFKTAFCESITSYILRMALAHSVLVYILFRDIIIPLLNKNYLYSDGQIVPHRLSAKWFKETGSQITGVNESTKQWVEVLGDLTACETLEFSTLIPWSSVLPYRSLIKKRQFWCPLCYSDMKTSNIPLFNPLIWSIYEAPICLKHQIRLFEKCPFLDCQKEIPLLPSKGCIGFCPSCYRWLGDTEIYANFLDISESEYNRTKMVGELIAAAPELSKPLNSEIFAITIDELIEELFGGNAASLGRYVGVNHKTVYQWRDGTQIPTLGLVLTLCEKFEFTPLEIFTEHVLRNIPNMSSVSLKIPEKVPSRKRYRKFNEVEIRNKLEAEAQNPHTPPRSMREVAEDLGYDHGFLIKKLPSQTQKISEIYGAYVSQKRDEDLTAELHSLRKTILQLHRQGIYPSHRSLRNEFGGKMRSTAYRMVRSQLLAELGYQ